MPRTLLIGIGIIALVEGLLFADMAIAHRGAVRVDADILALPAPATTFAHVARFVAAHVTPLAWLGYLLALDGLLTLQRPATSPARSRPHHFALLCLASVPIWYLFDFVNFYVFTPPAWTYIGIRFAWPIRLLGYLLAFAAIVPGMLMSGQVLLNLGLLRVRRPIRLPRFTPFFAFLIGIAMLAWPLLSRDSVSNFTLWTSLIFLLDPLNDRLGRPCVLRDLRTGNLARPLAAMLGGLTCGFLWEFWNYWALNKWIYHLPFLGRTESIRYFEMPVIGLLGFLPFGLECWVLWQTLRIAFDGLAEELPSDRDLL